MLKPRDFDPAKKYPVLVLRLRRAGEPDGDRSLGRRPAASSIARSPTPATSWCASTTAARRRRRARAWRKVDLRRGRRCSPPKEQAAAVRALLARAALSRRRRASAIWGWSGGGSNTLNAMFRFPDVYKVGVSVAPVPDQRLYDTIYQERYMGLPQDNADGYRRGSPINFAEGLKGKLLIVHGSGDDNVHYQGTERLVNRLVELGKPFDLMVYPNRTHAISEGEGHLAPPARAARAVPAEEPAGGGALGLVAWFVPSERSEGSRHSTRAPRRVKSGILRRSRSSG